MRNRMFSGWKEVFLFTIKQAIEQKYRVITIVLALILFAGGFAVNIFMALEQRKEDNISPIEKIYVIDESKISDINWKDSKQLNKEQFPKAQFETTDLTIEELGISLKDNEVNSVITKVIKTKDGYEIRVYIPYGSEITTDDGKNLAKEIESIVHEGIIGESSIEADKIAYVVSSLNTEFSTVGESAKSDSLLAFTTAVPMIFMMGLYFMVIIYGQSMGQIVSVEKSSKLMESLLVMTRPYGLIFGKILATSTTAILQMAVWLLAVAGGFIIGDSFAVDTIYEGYDNTIISLFKDIIADESVNAFTGEAIVLTVIAVCLAFLFYCMLAGAISSFASKADELNSVMMFYNMFIIIGFIGSYLIPSAVGAEWIKVIIRLVPVSAAFLLPGELLLGTVEAKAGVIYLLVLFAWTVLVAVFAGKVYKNQLFYRGQSLKDRLPWMKNNRKDDSDEQWEILHDEVGRPLEKSQKIGCFFIAISPIVIFMVIQIFASLLMTNIITRIDFKGIDLATWEVKDFVDYYHKIEVSINPVILVVNHLLILTIFGLWMYFVRRGIDKNNIIHIKSLLEKHIFVMLGILLVSGLSLCALANGVIAIEAEVIPSVVDEYMKNINTVGLGDSPYAIFAAVCLAPIGEELMCRGVCLHFGKKALGNFWYANLLQALLFGIIHMNWVQGVYAFFIGLVLGILVEKYESLLPAMIVHFIVNFSSSTWVPGIRNQINLDLTKGIIIVTLAGVIVSFAMYLCYKIERKSE